jgi:uncharacterized protein (TIGR03083 family)
MAPLADPIAAIRRESDRFYALAGSADPTRPVPSCPDWTVDDLVWHLGEVHWFWATDVELRAADPEQVEAAKPDRPAAYDELVAFGRVQADHMIAVLEATPDDVAVWTWALDEADHTAGFVRRHQVQEAAVHRWDLELAVSGQPGPVEVDAAIDAIDEVLAITLPWGVRAENPLSGSVHIHCTDPGHEGDGEWFVHPDGRVEAIHAKGDAAIRGTASDVLLALYTRVPLDRLDLVGDPSLAHELVARVNTE